MNVNKKMTEMIIKLNAEILILKEEIKEHKQNINSLCDELDDRCNVIDF